MRKRELCNVCMLIELNTSSRAHKSRKASSLAALLLWRCLRFFPVEVYFKIEINMQSILI